MSLSPTVSSTLYDVREQLAAVCAEVAERTAALNRLRTELRSFEDRYFREVGTRYAELDELEATIAEREAVLYGSDAARHRAAEARQQAQESRDAASPPTADAERIEPSPSLKMLFREVAKRIHPDYARDSDEAAYFTFLMAQANQAYSRGDVDTLQHLLQDHQELHTLAEKDYLSNEVTRAQRQLQHARRDLSKLEANWHELLGSETAHLYTESEAAAVEHRDLIEELASGLQAKIADAQYRLAFVERQMFAHGK